MKRSHLLTPSACAGLLSASLLAGAPLAKAATASTTPLGYTTVECLWSSDTLCSTAGITEKPDFIGKVTGAPAANVLTVDATPGWSNGDFSNTHYVRFTTGTKVGRYYTVTNNGSNTLTIDPAGDDLSTVVADDGVKLIKFWTLGTLFPLGNQDTIVESAGNLGFQRRTEVLFPDLMGAGINLSTPSDAIYFLVTGSGWRSTAVGFPAADDIRILPDMYFVVRHPVDPGVGGTGTEFVPMGHVEDSPSTIGLATRDTGLGGQDNSVAVSRPVAVALSESGLVTSGGFLSSSGALGFQRRDELLAFDLDVDTITADDQGINRSSVNIYYHNLNFDPDGPGGPMPAGAHWVNASTNSSADDELVFQPGTGVIVRKYNTAGGATSFWVFDPANPTP